MDKLEKLELEEITHFKAKENHAELKLLRLECSYLANNDSSINSILRSSFRKEKKEAIGLDQK